MTALGYEHRQGDPTAQAGRLSNLGWLSQSPYGNGCGSASQEVRKRGLKEITLSTRSESSSRTTSHQKLGWCGRVGV